MKTKKRITITEETFESVKIQMKKNHQQIYCVNCQQQILQQSFIKTVFAQQIDGPENKYLIKTASGEWLLTQVK